MAIAVGGEIPSCRESSHNNPSNGTGVEKSLQKASETSVHLGCVVAICLTSDVQMIPKRTSSSQQLITLHHRYYLPPSIAIEPDHQLDVVEPGRFVLDRLIQLYLKLDLELSV